MPLWYTMRKCPVYFLDIPFEERLEYIVSEYGKFEKENYAKVVKQIKDNIPDYPDYQPRNIKYKK